MRRWELADMLPVGVILIAATGLILIAACCGLGTVLALRTGRPLPFLARQATATPAVAPTPTSGVAVTPTTLSVPTPVLPTLTVELLTPTEGVLTLTPTSSEIVVTATPSATVSPAPTGSGETPPTPGGTSAPEPTGVVPPPPPGGGEATVIIVQVNKDEEWVELQNRGSDVQDLDGWTLVSENGNATCHLPSMVLMPDQLLRVWTMDQDAEPGDVACGLNGEMWNDDELDPAVLYNAEGEEVSRFP